MQKACPCIVSVTDGSIWSTNGELSNATERDIIEEESIGELMFDDNAKLKSNSNRVAKQQLRSGVMILPLCMFSTSTEWTVPPLTALTK